METAREITGYRDYLITDEGNVYSLKSGSKKRLKLYLRNDGYVEVSLYSENSSKNFLVHRLVLFAFVGPCPEEMEACHNDGDKMNNNLSNLRWDTPKANAADQIKHGTAHHVMNQKCNQAAAEAHRGKPLSDQHRTNVSASLLGKKRSEEAKKNYKASWTEERRKSHSENLKQIWKKRKEE